MEPPEMKHRQRFSRVLELLGLVVFDRKCTGDVVAAARGFGFVHRNTKGVIDVPEKTDEPAKMEKEGDPKDSGSAKVTIGRYPAAGAGGRMILLDPTKAPVPTDQELTLDCLPPALQAQLFPTSATKSKEKSFRVPDKSRLGVGTAKIFLTHKNFTMTEMLQEILPTHVVVPSGFEQVGHIAHINLTEPQLPYKKVIGEVLLDCNYPGVKTVVNKVAAISSEFRELNLEVLACSEEELYKDPQTNEMKANLTATVKQHGVMFRVPFDKVYWNSKLSREHVRLVDNWFRSGDELFDVMAGIGPFAIPAALKGLRVFANDLNPASTEAMKQNWELNTHKKPAPDLHLDIQTVDGRKFIEWARKTHLSVNPTLTSLNGSLSKPRRHFVLNLPATAVTFLDAFTGHQWTQGEHDHTSRVHVYCFSAFADGSTAQRDAVLQVEKVLNMKLDGTHMKDVDKPTIEILNADSGLCCTHVVRDVAPGKLMVCVSFTLPAGVFGVALEKKKHRTEAQ